MKKDRFLIGIIAGIGLLILIAMLLFFVRQEKAEYLPDDTPSNVVHNYILAVVQRDYERAYSYLIDAPIKPGLSLFQQDLLRGSTDINQMNVTIGEIFIDGDNATIQLSMLQSYQGPFNNLGRYTDSGQLKKENGDWKIVSLPYPLWSWNWYTEEAKPGF